MVLLRKRGGDGNGDATKIEMVTAMAMAMRW
jgi:hypothetical protein